MNNFKIVTNTRFTVDVDLWKRTYRVLEKRNGKIKILSILDGSVLFDDLIPSEILIDGLIMQNINELQDVVFNRSCICDPNKEDDDYNIFDDSFDKTFE